MNQNYINQKFDQKCTVESPDFEANVVMAEIKKLNEITIQKIVQRKILKFKNSDLQKLVIEAVPSDAGHGYFCCPNTDIWWANGLDDQALFADSFRLFDSQEEILQCLNNTLLPPLNTYQINIYCLELQDNSIALKIHSSLYPN